MTLPRFAARRDDGEADIIEALEALGFHVEPMSEAGLPDLLLSRAGRWYTAECKSRHGRSTKAQVKFTERARAAVPIFRSVEDVLKWEKELPK